MEHQNDNVEMSMGEALMLMAFVAQLRTAFHNTYYSR